MVGGGGCEIHSLVEGRGWIYNMMLGAVGGGGVVFWGGTLVVLCGAVGGGGVVFWGGTLVVLCGAVGGGGVVRLTDHLCFLVFVFGGDGERRRWHEEGRGGKEERGRRECVPCLGYMIINY